MSDIVKVSWSGGKDSSCAVMKHLELGHKVKAVCYIPMFTEEIPFICKNHYEFILRTADKFRALGAEVHIVTGETYFHFVLRRSSRGKFKGRMFGFPLFQSGKCGFKRDSKIKALDALDIGYYDYEDIGIAADEVARHGQLTEKKRSILCELGITEQDAKEYDILHDILSPHYDYNTRDGCALCPNAKVAERESDGLTITRKRYLWYCFYSKKLGENDLICSLCESIGGFLKTNTVSRYHAPSG